MAYLVDNLQEALENIDNFQEIKNPINQINGIPAFDNFTLFGHWYYNPNKKLFGPSKFIGYKQTTIAVYTGALYGNGGATNNRLKRFFNKVNAKDKNYSSLKSELDKFVKTISARANANGVIYIPKGQKSINYSLNDDSHPDEVSDQDNYNEGAVIQVTVNRYERDPSARQDCIDSSNPKYTCKACGINFRNTYGQKGDNFIHVHHIIPLSTIAKNYKVDPAKDLIQLCPNCHSMVHRGMSVNEIRNLFNLP